MKKNSKKDKSPLIFTTNKGINVSDRIKDGRTIAFTSHSEAVAHANSIRSYVYDLYCYTIKNGQYTKNEFYGWAVPK